MYDFEFAEDGRRVVCENHLLQVVDDNLVASIGAERCLNGGSNGTARVDVADDGAIFCVVAVFMSVCAHSRGVLQLNELLVASFEESRVGRVRY